MTLSRGYIHIYTGDGKGKSCAAFGLAIRAAGAGLKVHIVQFLKKGSYNEIRALKKLSPYVSVKQFGKKEFIKKKCSLRYKKLIYQGLIYIEKIITEGKYDLVIIDEFNLLFDFGLLSVSEALRMLGIKPKHMEIVLTGRNAPVELIDISDIVTEFKLIKHYFTGGVKARKGVEF